MYSLIVCVQCETYRGRELTSVLLMQEHFNARRYTMVEAFIVVFSASVFYCCWTSWLAKQQALVDYAWTYIYAFFYIVRPIHAWCETYWGRRLTSILLTRAHFNVGKYTMVEDFIVVFFRRRCFTVFYCCWTSWLAKM